MSKKSKQDLAPQAAAVRAGSEIVSEAELNDVMKKYALLHLVHTVQQIRAGDPPHGISRRRGRHGISLLSREQEARPPELHAVV